MREVLRVREYRASIVVLALVALVVALSFAVSASLRGAHATGELVVRVHDGEGTVHEFALQETGTHEIHTSLGSNTIRIEDGSVRMTDADCPNRSCLDQRPLDTPGGQIICLPHKLWVEVVPAGSDETAELDEDAVDWSDQDSYDTVAR